MSDTYDAHYVICPYCGHKHGDAWEITGNEESERKIDCDGCGKEFRCWADVSVWYAAEAIEPPAPPHGEGDVGRPLPLPKETGGR